MLETVEHAGFEPTGHCFALNALENRVYDLRLEDGRHVVAKFYRPGRWSREAILEEHRALAALADAELPVCAPLPFANGETLHTVAGIHCAVWPRLGGRSPDELSDDEVRVLGRLLARLHGVLESRPLRHRSALSSKTLVHEPLLRLGDGGFLPPACASRFRAAALELARIYDERSRATAMQAIHGDCHVGNLLRSDAPEARDSGWLFLDFDDLTTGPQVQDVWMLLPGRDAHARRQRELLVDAYCQFRELDPRTLELVEVLRGLRFVAYAGWIARRWEDPCFPDAFPHFGSEDYWETETRDLEQQLEWVAGSEVGVATESEGAGDPDGESDEPTNADFFWDLD